jgi:hypothetical protein
MSFTVGYKRWNLTVSVKRKHKGNNSLETTKKCMKDEV